MSFEYYPLDGKEKEFLNESKELMERYPLKWFAFMNIVFNKKVSYIKDTTLIIQLLELKKEDAPIVFFFLKKYLTNSSIEKIIYKKEFIIASFHSNFISSFFKIDKRWLAIPYYVMFTNYFCPCYFDLNSKLDYHLLTIKLDDKIVTLDLENKEKQMDKHYPLKLNLLTDKDLNLKFDFDMIKLVNSLMDKVYPLGSYYTCL